MTSPSAPAKAVSTRSTASRVRCGATDPNTSIRCSLGMSPRCPAPHRLKVSSTLSMPEHCGHPPPSSSIRIVAASSERRVPALRRLSPMFSVPSADVLATVDSVLASAGMSWEHGLAPAGCAGHPESWPAPRPGSAGAGANCCTYCSESISVADGRLRGSFCRSAATRDPRPAVYCSGRGCGSDLQIISATAGTTFARKGTTRQASSYSTTPSDQTSDFRPYGRLLQISGEKYDGEPTVE
mmetsp:Transcript_57845/g.163268  ORF Transcript_57845/g.163268 Transcript_57845/m.163268 type:complete len:240 (+) Transcript_57845:169-888(+)